MVAKERFQEAQPAAQRRGLQRCAIRGRSCCERQAAADCTGSKYVWVCRWLLRLYCCSATAANCTHAASTSLRGPKRHHFRKPVSAAPWNTLQRCPAERRHSAAAAVCSCAAASPPALVLKC